MTELADTDIKPVIIMEFHVFKKLEDRLSMLNRDTEDIKKRPKLNF